MERLLNNYHIADSRGMTPVLVKRWAGIPRLSICDVIGMDNVHLKYIITYRHKRYVKTAVKTLDTNMLACMGV